MGGPYEFNVPESVGEKSIKKKQHIDIKNPMQLASVGRAFENRDNNCTQASNSPQCMISTQWHPG